MATVLIVDDEPSIRMVLSAQVKQMGHHVHTAENGQEALLKINEVEPDLIITDIRMPIMDGMELLQKCKLTKPHIPIVILTAHGTVNLAVDAMKSGASDFLSKPFDRSNLKRILSKTLAESEIRAQMLHEDAQGRFKIIGRTKSMQQIYSLIEKIASSDATALIIGESGTGKELVARALHENSDRKSKPFIMLNCGAIPHSLFESELFGHERGAFTGAHQSKPGKFELAHDGTLFLDEIGELSKEVQVKLLRTLQDGTYDRVGGLRHRQANVRLIAATNRDLVTEVKNGNFREDLYYRLNVIPIELPPLRKRTEDIPLLVDHFLEKSAKKFNLTRKHISEGDLLLMQGYDWPGNIREMENILERATILTDANETHINLHNLIATPFQSKVGQDSEQNLNLKEYIRQETAKLEKEQILIALKECDGNVTHAAKQLGISRKSLQNKMREYELRDSE